jgi:hypothetical protein
MVTIIIAYFIEVEKIISIIMVMVMIIIKFINNLIVDFVVIDFNNFIITLNIGFN